MKLKVELALENGEYTKGQDVTDEVGDEVRPISAKILRFGPNGWPICELKFADRDHAWEWFKEFQGDDDPDFLIEQFDRATTGEVV